MRTKKVPAISRGQRLRALVKDDWVTVRNSLAHGSAYFDPRKECIVFVDRNAIVSWAFEEAWKNGIDIFLANLAILRTWNFVQSARTRPFEESLAALKKIARY